MAPADGCCGAGAGVTVKGAARAERCKTPFPLSRLLKSSLYEAQVWAPATFAVVPALFLLVAFAACSIPARRAANADPMVILRRE